MTTTTLCDHCGEPIDAMEIVNVFSWSVSSRPELHTHDRLDLHHHCYIEHYQPILRGAKP